MKREKRVLALTGADESEWFDAWRAGARPSAYPYGIEKLYPMVGGIAFAPPFRREAVVGKFRRVALHRLGYPVERALTAMPLARRAEVVIGMLEPDAVLPGLLRQVPMTGYSNVRLMALTCWAAERIRSGDATTRRRTAAQMNRVDDVIVFSANQVPILVEGGVDSHRMRVVPYGVDVDFYAPAPDIVRDIDVLSVGQDVGRDFQTLARASGLLDARIHVVGLPSALGKISFPPNVITHGPVNHLTYRDMLRRAKVVVISTHELAYPTGQSVALEAAAVGTPVVVTGTAPMSEYFRHERDALLSRPHEPMDLFETIERALGDSEASRLRALNARERVLSEFSTDVMWARVGALLNE